MIEEEARKVAEAHWNYTQQIILNQLELMERLYIEAMVHGWGHGFEDCEQKYKVGKYDKDNMH